MNDFEIWYENEDGETLFVTIQSAELFEAFCKVAAIFGVFLGDYWIPPGRLLQIVKE